jgi:hypothetical protein
MPRKRNPEAARIEKDYKSKRAKIKSGLRSASAGQASEIRGQSREGMTVTGSQRRSSEAQAAQSELGGKFNLKAKPKSRISSSVAGKRTSTATPHAADSGKLGTKPKSPHAGMTEKYENKGDKKKPLTKAQVARNKARAAALSRAGRKKPKLRRARRKSTPYRG